MLCLLWGTEFAAAKEPASPQSVLVLARPASESTDE